MDITHENTAETSKEEALVDIKDLQTLFSVEGRTELNGPEPEGTTRGTYGCSGW